MDSGKVALAGGYGDESDEGCDMMDARFGSISRSHSRSHSRGDTARLYSSEETGLQIHVGMKEKAGSKPASQGLHPEEESESLGLRELALEGKLVELGKMSKAEQRMYLKKVERALTTKEKENRNELNPSCTDTVVLHGVSTPDRILCRRSIREASHVNHPDDLLREEEEEMGEEIKPVVQHRDVRMRPSMGLSNVADGIMKAVRVGVEKSVERYEYIYLLNA